MNDRRVVITGLGVITPVGNDLATFWESLKNGVSGISMLDAFDTTGYDCRFAGQVRNFDPKNYFNNPKDVRRTDRYAQYRHLLGKKIVATGRLQPGGGKYEKPQVLTLRSIKELF